MTEFRLYHAAMAAEEAFTAALLEEYGPRMAVDARYDRAIQKTWSQRLKALAEAKLQADRARWAKSAG